ncbi:hypothetical protein QZM48_04370 [Burkholderia orbicola]|uniref:hypothetical protein n=1 Tax=Burkholderia orbicola TaxID=2978683 RepID=UPI00264FB768|nr:hypothetical protein [Burkholderia orbicola]MDN7729242.1 hypothetical protein [Burkholderia orbicola]
MQSITLTFSQEQMTVVYEALAMAPYGKVAPVVSHINAQVQAAFDRQRDDAPSSGAAAPHGKGSRGARAGRRASKPATTEAADGAAQNG